MGSNNNFDPSGPGGLKLMALSIILCFLILPSRADTDDLHCYSCIAIDCPGNSTECEAVREFTVGYLRSLYYLDNLIASCPKLHETVEWRKMEFYDSKTCPNVTTVAKSKTCAAGRIRISTSRGKDKPGFTTHATILGCAQQYLLYNIKAAFEEGRCDLFETKGNTTEQQMFLKHRLEIEHCYQVATLCGDQDFCVRHEQSVVKKFKDRNLSYARFDVDIVLIIVACIVLLFAAVIGVSLFCRIKNRCSFPFKNPPSNPQDSESEAADTNDLVVAVRSSIEE